jgi:hypothetical protein
MPDILARIRSEVERLGGVTIGGEDLQRLYSDDLTTSEQFMRIASIAHVEGWSFAFLPDGRLRFGSYTNT